MFPKNLVDLMVQDAKSVFPDNWMDIKKMFNKCSFSISVDIVIKQLGLFQNKNEFETLNSIKNKIKLFNDAEYVFEKMIQILCEKNILEERNNGYICINQYPDIENPAELLVSAARQFPEEGASFQWLARGYGGLLQFIKGKAYGEEIMFPWNDFSLIEEVYDTSDVYGFWSNLVGKTVKRIIENTYSEKITILEVGAGTGNGTKNVFKYVENVFGTFNKYIFTDISKSLIKKAKRKFEKYDFIEYKQLDITKDIVEQGFVKHSVDIILAVNVLHATDDLITSCKNLLKLVKKGGYVVIGEIAPPQEGLYRYMELTFGLLASYYNYNDKDIRPDSPIVKPDKWLEIFKKAGFRNAIAIPHNRLEDCDTGGVIIGLK